MKCESAHVGVGYDSKACHEWQHLQMWRAFARSSLHKERRAAEWLLISVMGKASEVR
jgi:hypothetical protein